MKTKTFTVEFKLQRMYEPHLAFFPTLEEALAFIENIQKGDTLEFISCTESAEP